MLALVFASCKKASERKCFKSSGTPTTKEIALSDFNSLLLNEHVAYELVQDSLDKVVIHGGENLINFIECKVVDGRLEVENKNKCAFLRAGKKDKDKIVVEIHFTDIVNIHYEGSEYLKSVGTIHSDYLTLLIRDGSGPVDMTLDSKIIYAEISHGWGDFTLRGQTESATLRVSSNGYCDVRDLLILDSAAVLSDTPGSTHLSVNGIPLTGFIKGSGNVYYSGTPSLIDVILTNTGKLVQE